MATNPTRADQGDCRPAGIEPGTCRHGGLLGRARRTARRPDRNRSCVEPLSARYLVDINKKEWFELAELPEVGDTPARRIIELRTTRGPFKDNNDMARGRRHRTAHT